MKTLPEAKGAHPGRTANFGMLYWSNIGRNRFCSQCKKTIKEYTAREYGATRLIMQLTKDIFEKLRECFPSEFLRIYILAVLKLLNNSSQKDIDLTYARSAISELLSKAS